MKQMKRHLWKRLNHAIALAGFLAIAASCGPQSVDDEASKDGTLMTRSEFTEFMRGDNYLCYDIREDGRCSFSERSDRFRRDGFRIWQFGTTADEPPYVRASLEEVRWEGNRLCDAHPHILNLVYSESHSTRASLDLSHIEWLSAQKLADRNALADREIRNAKTYYEYRWSTDNQSSFQQLTFIDGVLQPEKGFETVTVVDKSKGYVDLYE